MSISRHFPPKSSTWADAWDNCECRLALDFLRWRLSLLGGIDRDNSACQIIYLFVEFGPLRLAFAVGH